MLQALELLILTLQALELLILMLKALEVLILTLQALAFLILMLKALQLLSGRQIKGVGHLRNYDVRPNGTTRFSVHQMET